MWRSMPAFCFTVVVALLGSLEQAQAQSKPEIKPPAFESHAPARAAVAYFDFASDSRITPARVRELAEKYEKNVMIGTDSGNSDSKETMAATKSAGVFRHIYLEGPGGVTGNRGIAPDELARVKAGTRTRKLILPTPTGKRSGTSLVGRCIRAARSKISTPTTIPTRSTISTTGSARAARPCPLLKEQQAWAKDNGIKATIMLKTWSRGSGL